MKAFCRPLLRGFSPQWTFPMGRPSPRHGSSCPGADIKFLPGLWLKFLWTIYLPRTAGESRIMITQPGKSTAGNRPQGWRKGDCAIRRGLPTVGYGKHRFRRDRNARAGTVAASWFSDIGPWRQPKPRQRVRRRTGRCASSFTLSESGPDDRMPPGSRGRCPRLRSEQQKRRQRKMPPTP